MEEKKKEEPLKGEIAKLIKQRTYLWCAIIIIGFFVINQFALMHCSNKVLADQFTFASTISSIILSVIAIIMSVVSSDSINSLLHKFRDLHDEIKDVPTNIELSIESLGASSAKFEKLSNELLKMPQKIENSIITSIREMNETIESVSGRVEILNQTVEVGFMEITRNAATGKETLTTKGSELTEEQIEEQFLFSSSVAGLFILLYVAIAYEKKIKVSLLKLSKILLEDESQVDYAYGYFIAMASLGLFFDYDVVEKEYVYEITYVKADLLENVKK